MKALRQQDWTATTAPYSTRLYVHDMDIQTAFLALTVAATGSDNYLFLRYLFCPAWLLCNFPTGIHGRKQSDVVASLFHVREG